MKSFLRSFFASLMAILVVVLILVGLAASKSGQKSEIKDNSWLVIDLYGDVAEYCPPVDMISQVIGGKPETLQRILTNMEKVCVDDRIEGVLFKMSSSNGAGLAMIEEMRGAVRKVRDSGKKVYCFSDAMDRNTYYLASACDSIFMPPTGYFSFIGYSVTTEHILGSLEKLGINPNLHKIKDYKSAAEMIVRKDMSPEARENKEWMLNEYWDMFCSSIEADRGLTEEDITGLMERALFTVPEAQEAGLVDGVLYWDDIESMLMNEGEKKLRTVGQARYEEEKPEKLGLKGKKRIAVIHAQGMIGGRKNRIDPMFGIMMGHSSIVAELKKAEKDDNIDAIVFRVDSPGGESLASDLIGHQVEVTSKVKPVVVSMVDVAASGGYHISYRASRIVADPMTLTGSIGSISGKMNMKGLFDKLGVTHDFATKGPKALFYSPYRDFNEDEWKIFKANHWKDFNNWLADVADHRGMEFEAAEKLAHGRVWSGRQGLENGLVDELGGLDKAIEVAKELAGIEKDEKVWVLHYPKQKSLFEELIGGGNFTAVTKYLVYRYIRDDLQQTWSMMTTGQMDIMEDIQIK